MAEAASFRGTGRGGGGGGGCGGSCGLTQHSLDTRCSNPERGSAYGASINGSAVADSVGCQLLTAAGKTAASLRKANL